jgi:hypothetical protein
LLAELRFAAGPKFTDELTLDIAPAIAKHFGEELGLFGSRQAPATRIAGAGKTQRGVIDGQIYILGEPVDRVECLRKRCPTFEQKPVGERLDGEQLFQNPANPEVLLHHGPGDPYAVRRFAEQVGPLACGHASDLVHLDSPAIFRAVS